MDSEEPEAVVREYIARLQRQDESAFDLVAPDFVQHAAGPQGRDGLHQTVRVLDHDLGRPAIAVRHLFAAGDLVFVHLVLSGTHSASTMPLLGGVPVTGREVHWTFMHLMRVRDGLLAEHWACRDDLGLLVQLGAWPAPGAQAHVGRGTPAPA